MSDTNPPPGEGLAHVLVGSSTRGPSYLKKLAETYSVRVARGRGELLEQYLSNPPRFLVLEWEEQDDATLRFLGAERGDSQTVRFSPTREADGNPPRLPKLVEHGSVVAVRISNEHERIRVALMRIRYAPMHIRNALMRIGDALMRI